jgi:hypothetical protein
MWRCIHIWTASRGFCYLAMLFYAAGVGSGLAAIFSSLSSNELAEVNRLYSYFAFLFSLFFFYLLITIAIISKSIKYLKKAPPETRGKSTVTSMFLESFIANTFLLPCIGALTVAGLYIWPADHWRPLGILVPVFLMTQVSLVKRACRSHSNLFSSSTLLSSYRVLLAELPLVLSHSRRQARFLSPPVISR